MGKRKLVTSKSKAQRRQRKKKLKAKGMLKRKEQHEKITRLPRYAGFDESHYGPVYRFFKEEAHADALAKGDVFLSTLEVCRAYEHAEQGDVEEGHQSYHADYLGGSLVDPNFKKRLQEVGAGGVFEGSGNVIFQDSVIYNKIPDAYVLCTTFEFCPEQLNETFGEYCVEIKEPKKFFSALTKKIEQKVSLMTAGAGKVIYADRSFSGNASSPGPIGFVKPVEPYSLQKEYRFLWIPSNNHTLTPTIINCPEVSRLCRRIA